MDRLMDSCIQLVSFPDYKHAQHCLIKLNDSHVVLKATHMIQIACTSMDHLDVITMSFTFS